MNTGLTPSQIDTLTRACDRYPEITGVVLFGSRAKGNYKPGSDIDLAIKGNGVGRRTVASLLSDLEDTALPFFTDVVAYDSISNPELRSHIDRRGIVLR